jgi:hypothetical protein
MSPQTRRANTNRILRQHNNLQFLHEVRSLLIAARSNGTRTLFELQHLIETAIRAERRRNLRIATRQDGSVETDLGPASRIETDEEIEDAP